MTEQPGEVALVLHTHLPWLANHGVWPVGEEWLFQAWGHSWLPVTRVLQRLADEGHTDLLTLGVTPMVAAQVADERLARDLGTWLGGQMWRAEEQRWHWWLDDEVRELSHHHWRHHQDLLALHEEVEADGGLLAVWADLADRGVIELLGGPATHPYLPLVSDPAMVDGQLTTGLDHHTTWAGARPSGIWPPELGYRPAGPVADPTARPTAVDRFGTPTLPRRGPDRPGLEEHYARHGIDHVLVDAPTLIRAAGGADRDWTVRPDVPDVAADSPDEVVHDGVLIGDSDVVAFARDLSVAYRVWAPTTGYPGDAWYRDFHTHGTFGTHRSHRVTDQDVPWQEKAPYEPDRAVARTADHVEDFHGLLKEVLDPRPGGLVVAAYDTELFGHWWYEGPVWLEGLLRRIADDQHLRTTTLTSRARRHPPTRRLHLPESSWGFGKGHASWVAPATRPMWQRIQAVEAAARDALATTSRTDDDPVVQQLGREVAQLHCSDWPFMVTRGNSAEYAHDRLREHAAAAERLCRMAATGDVDEAWVAARATHVAAPADPTPVVRALRELDGAGSLSSPVVDPLVG